MDIYSFILKHVLNLCICIYLFKFVYMIFVQSSTVAAILCQLSATSNPKTVEGLCYAISDVQGLTSHHDMNYK